MGETFLKGRYRTFIISSSAPPFPVPARSKERVCGRSLGGIWVSNSAGGMNVSLVITRTVEHNLEVRHPRCVSSIAKNFVYYTYSQTQLYFTC